MRLSEFEQETWKSAKTGLTWSYKQPSLSLRAHLKKMVMDATNPGKVPLNQVEDVPVDVVVVDDAYAQAGALAFRCCVTDVKDGDKALMDDRGDSEMEVSLSSHMEEVKIGGEPVSAVEQSYLESIIVGPMFEDYMHLIGVLRGKKEALADDEKKPSGTHSDSQDEETS